MHSNNYNPKLWVQFEDVCKLLWEHNTGHNELSLVDPRKDLVKKITLGRIFRSKWSKQEEKQCSMQYKKNAAMKERR